MAKTSKAPRGLLVLRNYMRRLVTREKETGQSQFDMAQWGRLTNGAAQKLLAKYPDGVPEPVYLKPSEFNECGTSACLLGHMTMIPEFRRQGLRLMLDYVMEQKNVPRSNPRRFVGGASVVRIDKDEDSHSDETPDELGARYLGITEGEAHGLFFGSNTTKAKAGLKAVQRLVDAYERA
jgi:hypothetical protein